MCACWCERLCAYLFALSPCLRAAALPPDLAASPPRPPKLQLTPHRPHPPRPQKLSGETGRLPAQVVLRWVLQQGTIVLPRSTNADHMAQSLSLFDFRLSAEQEASLSGAR
jgi:diketogulonate reductase-like aldo/keto reductase